MKSILVISNDQRSGDLIRQFQPLLKRHIGLVADFDQGLKEIFDKRPAVVFIQSEIGGISGDAVAKHIKGLLRDDSPKLVLLREAPDKPFASRNTFDDNIDLFAANEDLFKQFKAQLEKVPTLQWCDEIVAADDAEVTVDNGAATRLPTEPPAVATPHAPPRVQPDEDASPSAWQTPDSEVPPPVPRYAMPPRPVGGCPSAGPASLTADDFAAVVPGFIADSPRSWDSRRPWLYLGGLLITCAAGVAFFVGPSYWAGRSVTDHRPVAVQPKAAGETVAKKALRPLPAAIPLSGRDPAYEAGHPGWERYQAVMMEYLVYREGGAIRAIQAISLRPEGIAEEFVRTFLSELTGTDRYTVTGTADKGGFLAETALLQDQGELMLYRQGPGGTVRAFVVAFN